MEENKIMNDKIIYQTENFIVYVPYKTHISREDGGHIWIGAKEKYFASRLDLSPTEAIEVMRLAMLISEAMIEGMKNRGINIERINYQDNGNWAYLKGTKPKFHIHLYGRTKESKVQIWGEALKFPNPDDPFYDNFTPFNDEDIEEIKKQISLLENTEKYKLENWK